MFDTVLVANRGEIAVPRHPYAAALGIRAVAVYTDADADAPHVRAADIAVRIESYLAIPAVDRRGRGPPARRPCTPATASSPRTPRSPAACAEAGIVFVGPPSAAIEAMGDKIRAKQTVAKAGVPVVPGSDGAGLDDAALALAVEQVGYPVLLKPRAGGGGKGMRLVHQRRRARRRDRVRPPRGPRQLRRRHPARRALHPEPAAHRDPGPGRHPRQRRSTSASASARCSAATRRSSRRRRRRCSPTSSGRRWGPPRSRRRAPSATPARARSSSSSTATTPTSGSSWR